jgi:hypothetical protein
MREKTLSHRSSVFEVCIYRSSQNMIAIVALRPDIDANFLSRESNSAHLDYLNDKRMLGQSQLL